MRDSTVASTGIVGYLKGRFFKYERNEEPEPLVYQLSDKASLGSYAPSDKS